MTGPLLHADEIAERFAALSRWLVAHEDLWRPASFYGLPVSWEADHPELSRWLRARTRDEVEALERDPFAVEAPGCFTMLHLESSALSAVGPLATADRPLAPMGEGCAIPGRKATQIAAFAGVVSAMGLGSARLVDWCAGKAHLGRVLANRSGAELVAVERDAALVAAGAAMRGGDRVRFVPADVLNDPLDDLLQRGDLLVALHACGALTDRALALAVAAEVAGLAVAPCCFHRVAPAEKAAGADFRALSRAGRNSGLRLDMLALRLPGKVEARASQAERDLRRRSAAWRLAVDTLLREATGEDRYHPVCALPVAALRGDFETYARAAAASVGHTLPAFDPARAEAAGWARAHLVRALGLAAQPFRDPLALWWVADRALFVAESGRPVKLGSLCEPTLTPRNLAIVSLRDPRAQSPCASLVA